MFAYLKKSQFRVLLKIVKFKNKNSLNNLRLIKHVFYFMSKTLKCVVVKLLKLYIKNGIDISP